MAYLCIRPWHWCRFSYNELHFTDSRYMSLGSRYISQSPDTFHTVGIERTNYFNLYYLACLCIRTWNCIFFSFLYTNSAIKQQISLYGVDAAQIVTTIDITKDITVDQCWQLDLQFSQPISFFSSVASFWGDGRLIYQNSNSNYLISKTYRIESTLFL